MRIPVCHWSDPGRELSELLPAFVESMVAPSDWTEGFLFPDEATSVATARPQRRREFALGRRCAREALHRLGAVARSIPRGADRAPVWPPNVVGSITHCDGFVGVAVAHSSDLSGIGIDAESAQELSPELCRRICTEPEWRWLAARHDDLPWGKLFFSAKEAVYKCTYPSSRTFLEFHDVTVELGENGRFTARSPRVDLTDCRGRWVITPTMVLTAAVVPASKPVGSTAPGLP